MTSRLQSTSGVAPWQGTSLVCLAGVIWGTIGPGVHLVHERSGFSVLTIGGYRATAALVTLILAAGVTGRLSSCLAVAGRHPGRVVAVGLLTAAFQLSFFVAVLATGVSVATVVALGLPPVLLLVLSSARRRRPPGRAEVLTVAVALTGLLLVGIAGGSGKQGPHPVWGVVAAVASGTAYALSADAGAVLSRRNDALVVTTVTMTVTAAVLVPGGLLLALARGEPMTTGDVGSWGLLAYLGVVTMAFAYVLLFAGLRSVPSGAAVVATLLEPVTGVLIAISLLGESLTPAGVLGSVLILGAIATLGRRQGAPQPQ